MEERQSKQMERNGITWPICASDWECWKKERWLCLTDGNMKLLIEALIIAAQE